MKPGSSTNDLLSQIEAEKKRGEALSAKLDASANARVTKAQPIAAPQSERVPFIRKGENSMNSRGFMFSRIAAMIGNQAEPEHCKHEIDICGRLRKSMMQIGIGWSQEKHSFLAPFASSFLPADLVDHSMQAEMNQMVKAGVAGFDRDEMIAMARKAGPEYERKAMSWLDPTIGGSLVGPPEFGELIDLFRNTDALINAGAQVIPLPPSGRIKYPRQTSASTGYWLGENANATETTVGTGDLTLSSKKCVGFLTMANEILRYATVAAEALFRGDLTKTLNLTMDQALLEGGGGDNIPLGLVNTPGVATVTPTTVAANGNTISPQDVYAFTSSIEANNGTMDGFIMRPELFYKFVQARAGVYNGSAVVAQGQYTFDQFREMGQGFGKQIGGFKATTTPQVSQSRVKGSGTNLTYMIGGMFSDFIIAMFGGIEFLSTGEGYTLARADQTAIRAILSCDGGPRHPAVFAVADNLIMTAIGV